MFVALTANNLCSWNPLWHGISCFLQKKHCKLHVLSFPVKRGHHPTCREYSEMILKSMVPVYPRGFIFFGASPTVLNCGMKPQTIQEIIVVDDGSEPPLQQLFQNDEKRLDQDPGTLTTGWNSLGFSNLFQRWNWCARHWKPGWEVSMRLKCYPIVSRSVMFDLHHRRSLVFNILDWTCLLLRCWRVNVASQCFWHDIPIFQQNDVSCSWIRKNTAF